MVKKLIGIEISTAQHLSSVHEWFNHLNDLFIARLLFSRMVQIFKWYRVRFQLQQRRLYRFYRHWAVLKLNF